MYKCTDYECYTCSGGQQQQKLLLYSNYSSRAIENTLQSIKTYLTPKMAALGSKQATATTQRRPQPDIQHRSANLATIYHTNKKNSENIQIDRSNKEAKQSNSDRKKSHSNRWDTNIYHQNSTNTDDSHNRAAHQKQLSRQPPATLRQRYRQRGKKNQSKHQKIILKQPQTP